jgi:hypothetical protein
MTLRTSPRTSGVHRACIAVHRACPSPPLYPPVRDTHARASRPLCVSHKNRSGGAEVCVKVKARADGFRELYCWLNQRDVLIAKGDRQEPLVVTRPSLAAEIAKRAAA